MANVNAPTGFLPKRHATGGMIRTEAYTIASEYGYAIGRGHPVELTGTGKNIQLAAAQNADSIGIFAGCSYVDANGSQHFSNYWPASTVATDIVALVWTDPDIIFEAQADACAEADVGLLADWNAGTTSTTYGTSGAYLTLSTGATTNQSMRVLGLVPRCDNAYGTYAKVECMWAESAIGNVVAGVGGVS